MNKIFLQAALAVLTIVLYACATGEPAPYMDMPDHNWFTSAASIARKPLSDIPSIDTYGLNHWRSVAEMDETQYITFIKYKAGISRDDFARGRQFLVDQFAAGGYWVYTDIEDVTIDGRRSYLYFENQVDKGKMLAQSLTAMIPYEKESWAVEIYSLAGQMTEEQMRSIIKSFRMTKHPRFPKRG